MNEIYVADKIIRLARRKAKDLGPLKGSIKRGGGNLYGFIGEEVVADYLGVKVKNTFEYDLILPNGKTVDVKTKRCTSSPKPEYACSVAAFNTKQACDYYVFVRVMQDLSNSWILGMMEKSEYFSKAKFCKKGEVDPDSKQGWKFSADCYNIYVSDLHPIEELNVLPILAV